jgi:Mn2+/Fe2+ NRAMP family transporter
MIQDMLVPKMPKGAALNEVMLLIIAIVGTTVAPWQLFFNRAMSLTKGSRHVSSSMSASIS